VNPWIILAVVLAFAGSFVAGDLRGARVKQLEIEHGLQEEKDKAAVKAKETEQQWRSVLEARIRYDQTRIAALDARLVAATDELRKRPERPIDLPAAARPACEGANGAELGASHAIFLARFAARAARQDGALETCYALIDSLKGHALSPRGAP